MFLIIITDPERPWTVYHMYTSLLYHSSISNKVVNACKKCFSITLKSDHLHPSYCVKNPNKLSTKNTVANVSKFWNVRKCIMKFVIPTLILYVLIKPMLISAFILREKIIQSFNIIMNVLYESRRAKYMYKNDHDEILDMVFRTNGCFSTQILSSKKDTIFDNYCSYMCGMESFKKCTVVLAKFIKNKVFFIHNKRPCLMQILTAKTTWSVLNSAISGSKGQPDMTPANYKHTGTALKDFDVTKKLVQIKKWTFEAKIGLKMINYLMHLKKQCALIAKIEKRWKKKVIQPVLMMFFVSRFFENHHDHRETYIPDHIHKRWLV